MLSVEARFLMYMCTYLHVTEPTYDQFRDDNQDMVSRCPSCSYIATTNLQLCHFLILQLFTLFDGLGSVLGSKEVADKAIAAYTEKRENVGKWFEEAIMEGNGLVEIFKKSSIDQGEPANRVKEEMDKLRKEKGRVDQLWLDAQQAKKAKLAEQESKTKRLSEENKPAVKPVSNGVVAGAPSPATAPSAERPETEGKEASPPRMTAVEPSPPEQPELMLQVAQTRSSSVEERGKDKVKVVKAQGSETETVSRWLTDEYAELEEEAYKVRGQVVYSGV